MSDRPLTPSNAPPGSAPSPRSSGPDAPGTHATSGAPDREADAAGEAIANLAAARETFLRAARLHAQALADLEAWLSSDRRDGGESGERARDVELLGPAPRRLASGAIRSDRGAAADALPAFAPSIAGEASAAADPRERIAETRRAYHVARWSHSRAERTAVALAPSQAHDGWPSPDGAPEEIADLALERAQREARRRAAEAVRHVAETAGDPAPDVLRTLVRCALVLDAIWDEASPEAVAARTCIEQQVERGTISLCVTRSVGSAERRVLLVLGRDAPSPIGLF